VLGRKELGATNGDWRVAAPPGRPVCVFLCVCAYVRVCVWGGGWGGGYGTVLKKGMGLYLKGGQCI
jgi:hypothetical protein